MLLSNLTVEMQQCLETCRGTLWFWGFPQSLQPLVILCVVIAVGVVFQISLSPRGTHSQDFQILEWLDFGGSCPTIFESIFNALKYVLLGYQLPYEHVWIFKFMFHRTPKNEDRFWFSNYCTLSCSLHSQHVLVN